MTPGVLRALHGDTCVLSVIHASLQGGRVNLIIPPGNKVYRKEVARLNALLLDKANKFLNDTSVRRTRVCVCVRATYY